MQVRWYRKTGPQVIAGFAILMLAALAWSAWVPTLAQRCASGCEAQGMKGQIVAKYTATQTAGSGGRSPEECKCV
ncbi:hypothetical protein [Roseateles sp. P5_D6]